MGCRGYIRDGVSRKGLQRLIEKLPCEIIMAEIGSFRGVSMEIFLDSHKIKKIFCIDTWENGYDFNDFASAHTQDAQWHFDRAASRYPDGMITKIKAPSENAVNFFKDYSLDFVYIDGNHTKKHVRNDISNWFRKIKKSGIIAGHDFNIPDVSESVQEILGNPHEWFSDNSWLFYLQKLYIDKKPVL